MIWRVENDDLRHNSLRILLTFLLSNPPTFVITDTTLFTEPIPLMNFTILSFLTVSYTFAAVCECERFAGGLQPLAVVLAHNWEALRCSPTRTFILRRASRFSYLYCLFLVAAPCGLVCSVVASAV